MVRIQRASSLAAALLVGCCCALTAGCTSSRDSRPCTGCTSAENRFLNGFADQYGVTPAEFYGSRVIDNPDDKSIAKYLRIAHNVCDSFASGMDVNEVTDAYTSQTDGSETQVMQAIGMITTAGIYMCPDDSGIAP
ncbi:hypothetical protein Xcel_2337 [Xylanimonas cellulosilytica DSM 15894]|uniref:DUF732 domain-containing protein n=1 Tax=Xylanimonas cellulosilytica (strain DSM 15894 / JCM 12276 / CECT 5975 / KCTC 9989 / LMG 20990 / NBRC 107835 / XIL07) TaxID=446471 RepID=D1BVN5_XYLCX|nr:DUF732 domain-containing protein [Xylanimonas cellulosilytica]ACZ31354.1 hypothetical protein Xcel_2337 [Xylanimonas cellulosilytica DSM 15894]